MNDVVSHLVHTRLLGSGTILSALYNRRISTGSKHRILRLVAGAEYLIDLLGNANEGRALRELSQLTGTNVRARGANTTKNILNGMLDRTLVRQNDGLAFT